MMEVRFAYYTTKYFLCVHTKSQLCRNTMTERCLFIFRWLFFLRVNAIIIVCANKRAMPHLLYRFQFQRSYNVGAFFLSFFFLFLIFVFTVHLSEGLRLTMQWCNGSFCMFHSSSYMMIVDMLLLC